MASGSNKLVDKYQYNDTQIKSDGFAEIITARHIVLREFFTLKKISITNAKAAAKYHSIVNEMNILKTLGDQPFLFKCHKMLKTSNNLYLVYDFMGNHPTLAQLIENGSLNNQSKKKSVALKIFDYLKKLKKQEVVFLELTSENIQVDDNLQVKFLSLEKAVFLNRNISSMAFFNLKISQNLAPQLKLFIEQCSVPYEKQIRYETFQNKLDKVDLFQFGKILQKLFSQQLSFAENHSQIKNSQSFQSFQSSIKRIVQHLTSNDPNQRPTYEQVESLLSNNINSSKKQLNTENLQIRVSKQQKSTLNVNNTNIEIKKSRSAIKIQKFNSPDKNELLLIPKGEDSYDKKSVRSSSEYTDSTTDAKIRPKKSSFANQIQSQKSPDDEFKAFVLKILTRRSLCKLLLSISKLIFEMSLIDLKERLMLSFLLLKKGVLLACSLARFVSTGKGDGEQLTIKESIRRQFAKTNDFFLLSVLIDKQMDNAKAIYQTTVGKLRTEFPDLKNLKQYNFEYECISENLNEKVLKQLTRKSLIQIINKLHTPVKQSEQTKRPQPPRMLLNPSDFLSTSMRSQVKIDDLDDTASVRSARTVRTNAQGNSNSQFILENFHSEKILRNIPFDDLILIYLMGLILDFESYEKMFAKLIQDSDLRFEEQSLLKELRKMQAREIVFKLTQIVK